MNLLLGSRASRPGLSNAFTGATVEAGSPGNLAFNESGRGAGGSSNRLEFLTALASCRLKDHTTC